VKDSPAEPYRPGQIGWRRDLTHANGQDVAFVPLFVKTPGQTGGTIDDSWVRTLDILPTILREAHVNKPSAAAGSALGGSRKQPERLPVLTNRAGLVELNPASLLRMRTAAIEQRARRFGTGSDLSPLFEVGPNRSLIGRRVTSHTRGTPHARFWGARRFVAVDPGSGRVPANVIGWLDGGHFPGRDLAVAVNGRIAAVGQSFKPMGTKVAPEFSLLVPESAFRPGFNDVRLYEVVGGRRLVELARSPRA
jgi:hypothetical protein